MSVVREIGVYDTTKPCNFILEPSYTPKICSWKASIMEFLLDSPIKVVLLPIMEKKIALLFFSNLDIKNEPTVFPIWKSENDAIDARKSCKVDDLIQINPNWPYKTISDYHNAYLEQKITPTSVAMRLLEIIKNPEIKDCHAIIEYHEDEIIEAAAESTQRYKDGQHISIIDGVPFFSKEEIAVRGYKISLGLTSYSHKSQETANSLKRLIDKGAIFCGTTSMVQMGSNPIGVNPSKKFPSVKNPWNQNHYCGGSSSGSAFVVAAGLCPFSLGVDGLGSIRIPAAMVGQVGLRSTYSRVSNGKMNSYGQDNPFIAIGPIACCVRDSAIVYSLMAGKDIDFPNGLYQPDLIVPFLKTDTLNSIKFGTCSDFNKNGDQNIVKLFKFVCSSIKSSGGSIKEVAIPELYETQFASVIGLSSYFKNFSKYPEFKKIVDDSEDIGLKMVLITAESISDKLIDTIARQRSRSMEIVNDIFKQVDILLLLCTRCSAAPICTEDSYNGFLDDYTINSHFMFSGIASLTGIPSISVGIGTEKASKLPVSIQILAKWWNEDILLDVANKIESLILKNGHPDIYQCPLGK